MSIHQSRHVWDDPSIERDEMIVLLAIADQANDAGVAWIGQESLARRTRQTTRNLRRNLQRVTRPRPPVSPPLIILHHAGKSRTNLYLLTPTFSAVCPDCIRGRKEFVEAGPPGFLTTEAFFQIVNIFSEFMGTPHDFSLN